MSRKRIAVLGSTGSIGVNALKVAASLKEEIEVVALAADTNISLLAEQASFFKPAVLSIRDGLLAARIKKMIPGRIDVLCGNDGLENIVSRKDIDIVVFAISGTSCLRPLICAIKHKKRIALANKEALVSAGSIVMGLAEANNVPIVPIDSEHSAIFQCLEGRREYLKKIYLTASGGPLLKLPGKNFDDLPPEFILKHPKWKMGKKISVDSATMMNKGLEIIEARWLFGLGSDDIEALIHPEAIIHSIIELIDGTFFAEMSIPDMRIPIQYAITYPSRFRAELKKLDFSTIRNLTLERPDLRKFPCLGLARAALKKDGAHPAVLNAADEEVVKKYLEGKIKFGRIPCIIEKVLSRYRGPKTKKITLDSIIDAENWAREEVLRLCH